jgi:hypothetical protein
MTDCSCHCHVRGIVGFFHCFADCCSELDVIFYESEAEHRAAHPPMTARQLYEHMCGGAPWDTLTAAEQAGWIKLASDR